MGVIYQAEDLQLDRRVAIKILAPGLRAYLQERNHRFQREARAAAQLSHPHIAAVYDAGTGQGWSWIAMEYVEGRTLRSIIADKRQPGRRCRISPSQETRFYGRFSRFLGAC
jgi:serine/threonine-protein kinase